MVVRGSPRSSTVVHGRPVVVNGRPMVVNGRPMVINGRPMVVCGRPRVVRGRQWSSTVVKGRRRSSLRLIKGRPRSSLSLIKGRPHSIESLRSVWLGRVESERTWTHYAPASAPANKHTRVGEARGARRSGGSGRRRSPIPHPFHLSVQDDEPYHSASYRALQIAALLLNFCVFQT